MKCENCKSEEIYTDNSRGSVYCGECGMVQEENMVVNTLQFDSSTAKSSMHGKIVSLDNKNIGTGFVDSSYYIKNTISSICMKLSLSNDHVMRAFRWYKLCLQHSLSKGKSILYTLCACIYITCREDGTPHLLIDFSNELRIDVFRIGRVFLKIQQMLGLDIAPTDLSLYMHRFVSQLNFKRREVLDLSVRLVSRMKKDWILTGRRPNNLCGAAILVASRVYGEEREIGEVARVVHASVSTITKRLREIAETESADLGIEEFKKEWLEKEENPPVSKKKKIKKEDSLTVFKRKRVMYNVKEENKYDGNISKSNDEEKENKSPLENKNICDFIETKENIKANENQELENIANPTKDDEFLNLAKFNYIGNYNNLNTFNNIGDFNNMENISNKISSNANTIISDYNNSNEEESDFNYDELILNEDEIKKKKEIWELLYGDYIVEQEKKKKDPTKTVVKRNKKTKYEFNSMQDAFSSLETKVSSKLNYSMIQELFNSS